ncbi:MAG: multidrug effflux MFS transporter [Rhodospirillales bacterium]|tara:strand:+ start:4689 stop:5879 length:1191 start_codon:yes stop_codon:yes gene_type:complete
MSKKQKYLFYALILGFLTMTGTVAVDLFIPAVPLISSDFKTGIGSIELSLASLFIGNGIGQIIYGSISDRFGRKPVILVSLLIYFITTIGAGLSTNIEILVIWRFFQGLMMASGRILANAVARDLFERDKLARFITIIMGVGIISSLFSAPLGGFLSENFTWRTVFWCMSIYAAATFSIFLLFFNETNKNKDYLALNLYNLYQSFKIIINNKQFILNVTCGGFVLGGVVSFLNSSSGILLQYFAVKPTAYGLMYSLVMVGYGVSAFINQKLLALFGSKQVMLIGSILTAFSGLLMLSLNIIQFDHPTTIILPMFFYMIGFAFVWPVTVATCLQPFPEKAGAASSLQGFIQNTMSAAFSVLLALMYNGTPIPLCIALLIAGILTLITCLFSNTIREI